MKIVQGQPVQTHITYVRLVKLISAYVTQGFSGKPLLQNVPHIRVVILIWHFLVGSLTHVPVVSLVSTICGLFNLTSRTLIYGNGMHDVTNVFFKRQKLRH